MIHSFLFHPDLTRMMLTLHRDLHHAYAQANMFKRHPPTLQVIFLFGTFPTPKMGGGVGLGRTARQGNEINTAGDF
jgi:hypothetical protein